MNSGRVQKLGHSVLTRGLLVATATTHLFYDLAFYTLVCDRRSPAFISAVLTAPPERRLFREVFNLRWCQGQERDLPQRHLEVNLFLRQFNMTKMCIIYIVG